MEGVKKRSRDESAVELPEVKKLRYDIFDTLDDVEVDVDPEVSELTSVMKSFQEEIELAADGEKSSLSSVAVVDQDLSTSDIGWLLEASDEELGLPPSEDVKELLPLPCFEPAAENCLGFEAWEFSCGGDDGGHERVECLGFDDLFGYEDAMPHFGGFF